MRNKIFSISAIFLLVLLAGCDKQYDTITLSAKIENLNSQSKVFVNSDNYICWENNDNVNVNGQSCFVTIVDRQTNIVANIDESINSFTALYPNENVDRCNNKSIKFTIENEYENFKAGFPVKAPIVAYCERPNDELFFRNAGAILGITINNSDFSEIKLNSIRITANNALICGDAVISGLESETTGGIKSNPIISIQDNEKKGNSILYKIASSDANMARGVSKTFYIPVPPTNATNTFRLDVDFTSGNQNYYFVRTTKSNIGAVGRNYFIMFPLTIVNDERWLITPNKLQGDGSEQNPYKIYNGNHLKLVKDKIDEGGTYTNGVSSSSPYISANYIQINDLSFMGGIGTDEHPFMGKYNGNGKTITLNGTSGVFHKIGNGSIIRSLTSGGNANVLPGGNCSIGGIVDIIEDGNVTIDNCINESFIGSFGVFDENMYLGGICGKVSNCDGVKFRNCKHGINESTYAAIFIRSRSQLNNVGGICGRYEGIGQNKITFIGCVCNGLLPNTGIVGSLLGYMCGEISGENRNIIVKISDSDSDSRPGQGDVGNAPQVQE